MSVEEKRAVFQKFDEAKAEEFAGRMVGVLNDAMLALMTSIGHQTNLFDAMAELAPSSSDEIASAASLDERYVREWLGAMTVGGIVEYDPAEKTYHLPPEHAACVIRESGPNNLAGLAQFVPLLGNVEGGIVESFRNGGGVPYSAYGRFQELMAEDSAEVYGATLIETTLPLIPGMVERLKSGADALDVGCGAGIAVNLMARAFPNSRFTGYDLSEEGVVSAGAEGLSNARFEVKDARALDEPGAYDLATAFDVIHDLAHPEEVLENIHDALRPGGTFLMVDVAASSHLHENIEHPLGPFLYTVSTMHCMTVSLSQNGAGLGTVWGEQKAKKMLSDAGFEEVEVKQVEGDILNNYYIATKG
ncbi:MAG: class I SAM-dependent methyltransferase [Rubrobacteraceae bacterium]